MTIQRKPIAGILDKFLNTLSFGKFQELKQKYGYDRLFHLQLGLLLDNGQGQRQKVTVEKNETVDITEEPSSGLSADTQSQKVPISPRRVLTLSQLVDATRRKVGDQLFFSYDPFNNNCQFFIRYLLEALGAYSPKEAGFLFQDLSSFKKELPQWLLPFSRTVTDLGATVANLRGKGMEALELQAVVIPKAKFSLMDARLEAHKHIDSSKSYYRETEDSYRFRNIPKQRFDPSSYVSKPLDNGVTLVLGKLISKE